MDAINQRISDLLVKYGALIQDDSLPQWLALGETAGELLDLMSARLLSLEDRIRVLEGKLTSSGDGSRSSGVGILG